MRTLGKTAGTVGRFKRDENGNFAVISGFLITTMALAVGFAVNVAQTVQVKSSLRNALDAAVTSTARDLTTGKIELKDARSSVEAFLNANDDTKFTTTDDFILQSLVIDQTAKTVQATATAKVDLAFPLFNTTDPQISIDSASVYSDKTIEIAMMLDITGSMKGQKIKDLKTAATNAVETFLKGQDPTKPRVRVAIVPYSDSVNTGSLHNVVHIETKFTTTEPPKLEDPLAVVAGAIDSCATERKGKEQFTDASPTKAMVNRDYRLASCPESILRPLTSNLDAAKATIASFTDGGSTAGHIGIQWSWYMLSPKWNDVLPVAAQPKPYGAKKVAKYAILMTDGEFNTAFADVGKNEPTRNAQANRSRDKAETLCEEMKKDGIEIFSVGFMLKEAGAKGVMKNCATAESSGRHYFEAATGEELNQAFQEIARNIERLALTK